MKNDAGKGRARPALLPPGQARTALLLTTVLSVAALRVESRGKWEPHVELGEMWRGMWRFSTKRCYVGRTPGMFETVGPGFLRFSPCRAKELQTDIQTISTSERARRARNYRL